MANPPVPQNATPKTPIGTGMIASVTKPQVVPYNPETNPQAIPYPELVKFTDQQLQQLSSSPGHISQTAATAELERRSQVAAQQAYLFAHRYPPSLMETQAASTASAACRKDRSPYSPCSWIWPTARGTARER